MYFETNEPSKIRGWSLFPACPSLGTSQDQTPLQPHFQQACLLCSHHFGQQYCSSPTVWEPK